MPKTIPSKAGAAEDPINAFGSMLKAGIVGHLRAHPNAGRREIADALDVADWAATPGIDDLLEVGLRVAGPPRDEATRGQHVRYRVNDEAVTEMYPRLRLAIGEILLAPRRCVARATSLFAVDQEVRDASRRDSTSTRLLTTW